MYAFQIITLIGIYAIAAGGTNLVTGYTGLVSLGQAALFGVGAYTTALVSIHVQSFFPFPLICGVVAAAAMALPLAGLSLRLSADYFIIATMGFQLVAWSLFNNWQGLTNGPFGIPGIPAPVFFGYKVNSTIEFAVMVLVIAGGTFFLCARLVNSPYGRVLKSIREDEVFAQSIGKNSLVFKITAFAMAGAVTGLAGGLFAQFSTFIDPTSFTITESVFMLSIVIVGGSGSLWGPVVGSIVLVTLPEILRFIGLPSTTAANLRQILYGSLLVLIVILRPRGLVGNYAFGR